MVIYLHVSSINYLISCIEIFRFFGNARRFDQWIGRQISGKEVLDSCIIKQFGISNRIRVGRNNKGLNTKDMTVPQGEKLRIFTIELRALVSLDMFGFLTPGSACVCRVSSISSSSSWRAEAAMNSERRLVVSVAPGSLV